MTINGFVISTELNPSPVISTERTRLLSFRPSVSEWRNLSSKDKTTIEQATGSPVQNENAAGAEDGYPLLNDVRRVLRQP